MDRSLQIIVDSGLCVLIWLVQLIIYPSFHYIKEKDFVSWHSRYTFLISVIVTPLILTQAGIETVRLFEGQIRWWHIMMIGCIWLSTFIFSVPCHRQLQKKGKETSIIKRLVGTNWLRTILWSMLFFETVIAVYV